MAPPQTGDATMVGCTACVCCVTEKKIVTANAGDRPGVGGGERFLVVSSFVLVSFWVFFFFGGFLWDLLNFE